MKVIGINTSHDTAICSMTDGKIDFYHEEARWCRNKWFTPEFDYENDKFSSTHFQSLDYAFGKDGEKVEEYDTVGFVSFDRRNHEIHFKYKEEDDSETDFNYLQDRFLAEDIRNFLRAEPITRERVDECAETFREHFTPAKGKIIHQQDANDVDVKLNDKIIEPYGITSCLLYTSPSPRDISGSRMPSSA